jgi:hypothetical protein
MNAFRSRARVAGLTAAVAALSLLAVPAPAGAEEGVQPPFNLTAGLHAAAGGPDESGRLGVVRFRQPKDEVKIIYLRVRVRNLAANHSYFLQRATDTNVDDSCTGANWLTLGQGLTPEAIATDEMGRGRADLFRDLAAIPVGMQFDIHFRVIDAVSSAVVLESGCYQFTLRQ